ncbi:MAG: energy transducer TonB [Prevotellaceae bacterium]|jgi:TonB family protein|nr:energy transducer TonB [Prevotellaceae bacterium]
MDTPEHSVDKDKIDALFVEDKSLKQWIKDNQIGIYTTVIFHLVIFLALALNEIRTRTMQPKSIELIFHNVEQEPEITPEDERKQIEEELNKMLREMPNPDVRLPNLAMNAAVQGSESGRGQGAVSFFSNRNSSSIREERERREKDKEEKKNTGVDDVKMDESAHDNEESQAYKGPSIVSYYLEGRTAIYLPVPAYKCLNGGDVVVLIDVNVQGYVVVATIDKRNSSNDDCLHRAAIDAAERARFSTIQKSGNQKGNIVYRFVPQ